MENLRFRKALTDDAARIMKIIHQAQAQMRALGSDQWQDGYPAEADIARDIAAGAGYVLCRTAPARHDAAGTTGPAEPAEPAGAAEQTETARQAATAGQKGAAGQREEDAARDETKDGAARDETEDGAARDEAIAYGALSFDGEPAYEALEGRWLTAGPYVVLHRLAVADEAKRRGVAGVFMRRAEALARGRGVGSFRVDTNFDNRYMLRLIERQGFAYCGKVRYRSGERLAFEKLLER